MTAFIRHFYSHTTNILWNSFVEYQTRRLLQEWWPNRPMVSFNLDRLTYTHQGQQTQVGCDRGAGLDEVQWMVGPDDLLVASLFPGSVSAPDHMVLIQTLLQGNGSCPVGLPMVSCFSGPVQHRDSNYVLVFLDFTKPFPIELIQRVSLQWTPVIVLTDFAENKFVKDCLETSTAFIQVFDIEALVSLGQRAAWIMTYTFFGECLAHITRTRFLSGHDDPAFTHYYRMLDPDFRVHHVGFEARSLDSRIKACLQHDFSHQDQAFQAESRAWVRYMRELSC